jgi:hypothetical protein
MSRKKSNSQKQARAQRARRLRQHRANLAFDPDFDPELDRFVRHWAATEGKIAIGWAALYGKYVLCDMDALIIAGSEEAIRRRAEQSGAADWQFYLATCGEILMGLHNKMGYAFDEEAYARFAPLAIRLGLPVPPPLPIEAPPGCDPEDHLVHIYPFSAM